MRKFFLFLLVCSSVFTSKVTAKEDDSFLIKRAYLDVIGMIPTQEELEWYTVYNTSGYGLAIEYLLKHKNCKWTLPHDEAKAALMSKSYRKLPKIPIPKKTMDRIILFISGQENGDYSESHVEFAKEKLIEQASVCSNTEDDAIDYLANSLMCRTTNAFEMTTLSKLLKDSKKNKTEKEAWKDVFNEILKIEDCYKY